MFPEDNPNNTRYELLAEKWLNGTITPAEAREYADHYLANQDKPIDIPASFAASREEQHDRILNHLHRHMESVPNTQPVVHRIHFLRRPGAWAAAAILLLMAGGAWFLFNKSAKPAAPIAAVPAQRDILPGGNKAILTLSGGATIVLDSAAKGALARQGGTSVVKLADGQLAYAANSATPAEILYNTLSTPRGGQYRLTLPDGTNVWLNAASSITYPAAFAATERKVTITGEAYFEVAENKTKPFYVQVNNMTVTVLGTHFNINAYTNEVSIKTTLLEGSVQVSKGDKRRQLSPGQQAQISSDQPAIKLLDDVNTAQVVAWKDGLFDFKNADLATVLRQLERWYDVQVQYKGELPPFAFEGKLQRSLKLSQVVRALKENEINYTLEGHVLTIKP